MLAFLSFEMSQDPGGYTSLHVSVKKPMPIHRQTVSKAKTLLPIQKGLYSLSHCSEEGSMGLRRNPIPCQCRQHIMTQDKEQCSSDKYFSSMKISNNNIEFFENKEYSEESHKFYMLFSLAATHNMHAIYRIYNFSCQKTVCQTL